MASMGAAATVAASKGSVAWQEGGAVVSGEEALVWGVWAAVARVVVAWVAVDLAVVRRVAPARAVGGVSRAATVEAGTAEKEAVEVACKEVVEMAVSRAVEEAGAAAARATRAARVEVMEMEVRGLAAEVAGTARGGGGAKVQAGHQGVP